MAKEKEKKQKNRILQTENKIVDFSYFGSSNIKSENSTNKNKVINTINFSFNPTKIVFNNNNNNNIKNKEQNKGNEENENNNKEQSINKNLASLIEPCSLSLSFPFFPFLLLLAGLFPSFFLPFAAAPLLL